MAGARTVEEILAHGGAVSICLTMVLAQPLLLWLKHYSMLYHPGEMKPEQPGVNGVQ